ncbi:hypothetical protein [Streptomyces sp. NPDC006739]|uniref:hypothetical protein n=1 Tax=Streptomyces sp. NPDC006739 TaxID=3364763 RepID=UPI0036A51168
MSVNCNKAEQLSSEALRNKKRLAQNAGLELLAATSEVFQALELSEHGDSLESAGVYMTSAENRLRQAGKLLSEVLSLLESGTLAQEMTSWYQRLDYPRLYETAVEQGYVPPSLESWTEIAEVAATGGPQAMCRRLIGRVLQTADLMADWLQDRGTKLPRIQSAVIELTTYARLLAYFNEVEPGDKQWLQSSAATANAT